MDTSLRYKNDNQTGQFGNQRTVTIAGPRETVGSQVAQQTGIQCFNCKEFGHFTKECRKPKRVKDYSYHKEKILLCKKDKKESRPDIKPLEQADSNVILDSPNMCDDDIQNDQNAKAERVALANLIANLTLDTEENKKILKQLKKENASLIQELEECKSNLEESNTTRDSCLIVLQYKQTELVKYMSFNDHTVNYDKLKHKLNETLRLLAQKEINIKEGLKLKAYEISVVKEKHNELIKQSFLTKSHYYEGLVKEKTKVITDLKLKEEKDIDKMISMEKQLKFLNEIVYKRNQSIQTIYMLAPKGPTFNVRSTSANPMYLKKAQSENPCLYEIPYDKYDPANKLVLDREETLTLKKDSQSKLNKDLVRPYDYTKLNSLYDICKPATQEYHEQLAHANERNIQGVCGSLNGAVTPPDDQDMIKLVIGIDNLGQQEKGTTYFDHVANWIEPYLLQMNAITSLQSGVASLDAKGSLDANEEIKKAHTRVHELEKQMEKLPMEL
uniref:Myosin heavy chain-related protein n=1 Tax=Tanacetum cinerariifolium TaxID=118510 RepID=A0A6L2LVR1_TANCI|nr:myosin heavy chain-related protein [Tanacetum cinerariifolium]